MFTFLDAEDWQIFDNHRSENVFFQAVLNSGNKEIENILKHDICVYWGQQRATDSTDTRVCLGDTKGLGCVCFI